MPSATCQLLPNALINPTAAFSRCTCKFRFACLGDRLVPAQRSRAIADAHVHAAKTKFRNLKAAVAECACLQGRCPVVGQPPGLAGITWLSSNRRTGHRSRTASQDPRRAASPLSGNKALVPAAGLDMASAMAAAQGTHALQEEPEAHHGPQELTRRIASTAVRCDAKSTRVLTAVGLRCMPFLTRTGAAFSDEANLSTMACVIDGDALESMTLRHQWDASPDALAVSRYAGSMVRRRSPGPPTAPETKRYTRPGRGQE